MKAEAKLPDADAVAVLLIEDDEGPDDERRCDADAPGARMWKCPPDAPEPTNIPFPLLLLLMGRIAPPTLELLPKLKFC